MASMQSGSQQSPRSQGGSHDLYVKLRRDAEILFKEGSFALAGPRFERAAAELLKLANVDRRNPALFSQKQAVVQRLRDLAEQCRNEGDARVAPPQEAATQRKEPRGAARTESRPGAKKESHDGTLQIEDLRVDGDNVRFGDIIGHETAKQVISERLLVPMRDPETAARLKVGVKGGMLLYGVAGTAKSSLAKAVAAEIGYPCYAVDCSDIDSKWVGDGGKNVRALFDQLAALNQPVILILDECDALLSAGDHSTHDSHRKQVAIFKQRLEGLYKSGQIFFIGTTNYPERLEPAILSRCGGRCIPVGLPTEDERKRILEIQFTSANLAPSVDFSELARMTHDYAGRDLVELSDDVKLRAMAIKLQNGEKTEIITREIFLDVLARIGEKDASAEIARLARFKPLAGSK